MTDSPPTAVITGASRGIGRQIALEFARTTDHPLFLIARDSEVLDKVKDACIEAGGSLVQRAVCDLTDPGGIRELKIPDELPAPGILINNAGTFLLKTLEKTTAEEFTRLWKVNALGPFELTKKLLPSLKQQKRGLVVNICSVGALKGQAESGAYSSSKHAMLGFSRSLRLELRDTNVAVTAINLGQTMSSSWEGVDVDPAELNDPEDIARLIVLLGRFTPRTVAEEITLRPQRGDRSPD